MTRSDSRRTGAGRSRRQPADRSRRTGAAPSPRQRVVGLLGTPFGLAVLACLALAGWAVWSGGALDGPIARHVRTSSFYADPGLDVDRAAAERIIGNRRLVVVLRSPDADLRDTCKQVSRAADGTVVLVLSRDGDDYDTYGCALVPGYEKKNLGKAAAAEMIIGRGIDTFADRPLEAVKVIAVNYDRLVKAGTVPDGSRTISPSLPRFLLAVAAVLGVVAAATALYLGGRRAGRLAAARRIRRDELTDSRSALSAATAGLAQQIIDLDPQYALLNARRDGDDSSFVRRYRQLTSDHAALLDRLATLDGTDDAAVRALTARVESLSRQAQSLADGQPGTDA
ncbi:hypothetical protein [Micromonospora rifamycinica]|uniref:TPM domain-containing protein n=1 Tax=Micromonospora rifamycinica TaxID=291594 RepID=A0A1C5KE32_9ACTN|nr:hypothetical protein [Micromonospora rifamycinica]SCG80656.1 hypothetical protein GA0070623_5155 [Micromonospora rifamycinica]